jgi:hypothetical protein
LSAAVVLAAAVMRLTLSAVAVEQVDTLMRHLRIFLREQQP